MPPGATPLMPPSLGGWTTMLLSLCSPLNPLKQPSQVSSLSSLLLGLYLSGVFHVSALLGPVLEAVMLGVAHASCICGARCVIALLLLMLFMPYPSMTLSIAPAAARRRRHAKRCEWYCKNISALLQFQQCSQVTLQATQA